MSMEEIMENTYKILNPLMIAAVMEQPTPVMVHIFPQKSGERLWDYMLFPFLSVLP